MALKYDRWTKFAGKCLAWFLWYKNEPGIHVRRSLPGVYDERWTLPDGFLSEEH